MQHSNLDLSKPLLVSALANIQGQFSVATLFSQITATMNVTQTLETAAYLTATLSILARYWDTFINIIIFGYIIIS